MAIYSGTHLQGKNTLSATNNTLISADVAGLTKYYNSNYVDHTCVPGIYINMVLSEESKKEKKEIEGLKV